MHHYCKKYVPLVDIKDSNRIFEFRKLIMKVLLSVFPFPHTHMSLFRIFHNMLHVDYVASRTLQKNSIY